MTLSIVRKIFVALLLVMGATQIVGSQNNVYKIKDSLYVLYGKCMKDLKSPQSVVYIDSMYNESVRLGDKKAQCIAQSLRVRNTMAGSGEKVWTKLHGECDKLRELSRATNYMQYYYYAYQLEVTWLLNNHLSARALSVSEQLKKDAFAENDYHGIYNSYRTVGDIYFSRNNYEAATKNYKLALDCMLKYLPNQSPADIYVNIASAMRNSKSDEDNIKYEALRYATKAEETAKQPTALMKALELKCAIYFSLSDKNKFEATYDKIEDLRKKTKQNSNSAMQKYMIIYKAIFDGDYDKADKLCDRLMRPERYFMKGVIEARRGNYMLAYDYDRKSVAARDSVHYALLLEDIAEFNAQLGNAQLHSENMQLDLNNATLRLNQMKQQMALQSQISKNQNLEMRNVSLNMQRAQAEAKANRLRSEKLQAERERDFQTYEMKNNELKMHNLRLTASGAVLLVLVVCVTVLYLRRKRIMRVMAQKNADLIIANQKAEQALAEAVEARRKADQANKMKMRFMQNMSHEIRTPLNSIVGFTQLLIDPNVDLTDDERKDFYRLVEQNSSMLTNMVNDILNISDIESGNYVMNNAMQPCNELGRDAISMVEHRCPAGVKLVFSSDVPDDFQIYTDRHRVEQVLINFLTNAEKYTEEGEIHLRVSQTENPGKITYSVTDTGAGVPQEEAENIFERFRKLDTFKQGCGLGLNICRMIARQMNSEVKLDTSYTDGARFVFIMPITTEPEE